MPPPTSVDSWLTARRFGIVIDAGSSGSRLQIYSWKDPRVASSENAPRSLPRVEKGTREGEEWSKKVEPGISSFGENPQDIGTYLAPLLDHARSHIPPSLESDTPLFLLATAGMRLLSPAQQSAVLEASCRYFRDHSNFRLDDSSSAGPCGSSVRIISGEEEGLFGWIAVNYLMDGFAGSGEDRLTYGFLDMGGASTQIAFEPSIEERRKAQNLVDVRLRLLDGHEVHHEVFVTTWLGYGTNQARERYVGSAVNDYESHRAPSSSSSEELVPDPCLPKDLQLVEAPVQPDSASHHAKSPHTLLGTGSFEQCLQKTLPLLNKDAPCPDAHCLFNGVYVPPIDFSASHFIGVSEYWYSSEHVFGLGGSYDVVQYERAASEFCSREWSNILRQHELSRQQGRLGGDEKITVGGEDAGTVWDDNVGIPRLQMQCFKAAWVVNILHEGIGMPRIVDPGGNSTIEGDKVAQQAENKGLGRPMFQSMDSVGDIAISWTLGKMVLEASKEVPPLSSTDRPLSDPLDGVPDIPGPPGGPARPPLFDFEAIEDRIADHLPSHFTRQSLGFSPVAFLFYGVIALILSAATYRLRYRIKSTLRRSYKKERAFTKESYSMEEGQALNGGAHSPSPWRSTPARLSLSIFHPFKKLLSFTVRTPSITVKTYDSSTRNSPHSPARVQSLHSFTFPGPKPQYTPQLSPLDPVNGAGTAFVVPGSPRLSDGNMVSNGSLSSLTSRSRNSSQMNLASSLTPRQMTSRTISGPHTPIGSLFLDE